MFRGLMPPHAVEECLPPKLTEWQALTGWLQLTFPSYIIGRADRNDLVRIKNEIDRSLKTHGVSPGASGENVPSNPPLNTDAGRTPRAG